MDDKGFPSKYDGTCRVCLHPYQPGDLIATAPREYHARTRSGNLLRFAHLACALRARAEQPSVGGAR